MLFEIKLKLDKLLFELWIDFFIANILHSKREKVA